MSDESSRAVGTNPSRQIGTFTFSPATLPTLAVEFAVRPCVEPSAELGLPCWETNHRVSDSFWTAPGTEVVSGARTSQGRRGRFYSTSENLLLPP